MACSHLWDRIGTEMGADILTEIQARHKILYGVMLKLLAPRLRMKVVRVLEMPKVERHKLCCRLLGDPEFEPLTLNIFTNWLRDRNLQLIMLWLDHLQIEADPRGCFKTTPQCPDTETLRKGVDLLLSRYPPEVVLIYLFVFNEAIETRWLPLWNILQNDIRFPLPRLPDAES